MGVYTIIKEYKLHIKCYRQQWLFQFDDIQVTLHPSPLVDAGIDQVICEGKVFLCTDQVPTYTNGVMVLLMVNLSNQSLEYFSTRNGTNEYG